MAELYSTPLVLLGQHHWQTLLSEATHIASSCTFVSDDVQSWDQTHVAVVASGCSNHWVTGKHVCDHTQTCVIIYNVEQTLP